MFQIALFVCILIGIALIILSLFIFNSESKNKSGDYFETSNTIKAIETSIEEMDKTMDEFHNASKVVFREIDEKYQELLFLYSLIDEKRNEVSAMYSNRSTEKPIVGVSPAASMQVQIGNPNLKKILGLQKDGLSISEIAKKLDMGQGEVKLILELGKAR